VTVAEFNIVNEVNIPLYIADSTAGSAPHIPEKDAPLIMEMNADSRIVKRFGTTVRNLEETEEALNSENDVRIIQDLLNAEVPYTDSNVLERRIQVSRNVGDEVTREMIGWVALYRSFPDRLTRFFKEGLLSEDNYDIDKYPVLEISYAREKEAPKGILREGVQAEIYRLYATTMNTVISGKTLAEIKWEETNMSASTAGNPKQISYNQICPIRVIATIDLDNLGSVGVAESLGFVKKGVTKYETPEEAENPDTPDAKDEFLYELDWDKFMEIVDSKTVTSFRHY
jgi:hypothetical protein